MDNLFFSGKTTNITLPSGRQVEIRETNAADDELISNIADIKESTNIIKYLASIIVTDVALGRKPTIEEVYNYHYNDQWYLILVQRIINRGVELTFTYKCPCPACKEKPSQSYTEDLSELDADLSKVDYAPTGNQIMKYPLGIKLEHEFRTSSGHLFKFHIMTGIHNKKRLDLTEGEQTRNSMLTLRNLKIKDGEEWKTVTSFSFLPSKVASELRAEVIRVDPEWHPIITGECPAKTPFAMSLWSMPDFFWPGEEI